LMIYVTHDQVEALTFADRVVVMKEGQVLQIGTPLDLFERPEHTFVGYFIGSPGMNLLPARLSKNRAQVSGHEIKLDATYPTIADNAQVQIGVRPDHVTLTPSNGALRVNIDRIDDLGRTRLARVRIGSNPLVATVPPDFTPTAGEAGLRFEPGRVHVYVEDRRVQGVAA
jgi:glycerol transport system ATP-binding protein